MTILTLAIPKSRGSKRPTPGNGFGSLHRYGFDNRLTASRIQAGNRSFDLQVNELEELTKAGTGENQYHDLSGLVVGKAMFMAVLENLMKK